MEWTQQNLDEMMLLLMILRFLSLPSPAVTSLSLLCTHTVASRSVSSLSLFEARQRRLAAICDGAIRATLKNASVDADSDQSPSRPVQR